MSMKGTRGIVNRGFLETVSLCDYGVWNVTSYPQDSRFVCYRATFVSYRTTPLMRTPYQTKSCRPVDGTTSGGRQIGAAARSTGSIRNWIHSYIWVGRVLIQSAGFVKALAGVPTKERFA